MDTTSTSPTKTHTRPRPRTPLLFPLFITILSSALAIYAHIYEDRALANLPEYGKETRIAKDKITFVLVIAVGGLIWGIGKVVQGFVDRAFWMG
ncbi:MAG: hypothetical protein LQ350_003546 [Teloschistes chrysophthalmus]|nr:MAG: hypothetical protein LQ350_003546 [Niorma chrysophthalma]